MKPVPLYQQKQAARTLLHTAAVAARLSLTDLVKVSSTLRAIAFKARKLGLAPTRDFQALSTRITEIEIYELTREKK